MLGELSPGASVALGVIVGLCSTSVQSVGLTLQRKSHLLEDEKEDEYARRPPYRRRRWQVGMLMFLIANLVGSTVQITTLPLPVLSTLQASGLVFNTICATLLLHEPFTRFSLLGTLLVAGGAVLIGIFGAMTEPSHNLQQLLDLLARPNFLIWLIGTFLMVIAIIVIAWLSSRLHLKLSSRSSARMRLFQGMMYGAISGILSAHCLLVAKSAVELLVRTIVDRHNQFNRWQSWLILIALVLLALSQLYYLHRGLKLCSTSVLYPFVFCIYNIIAILDGLIYFRQTSRLPPSHAGLIALGTVVLLGGVVALSWRLSEPIYAPTSTDETDRVMRTRSMSRIATPTIPQTVLAPGMGIVEGTPTAAAFEDHIDDDGEDDVARVRHDDEESVLRTAYKRNVDATESTPLLRTTTVPNPTRRAALERKRENGSGASIRPHKLRRTTVTTPGAAEELWDELVENDGYRRRSVDFGTMIGQKRTPSATGSLAAGQRPGSRQSPASVRFKNRPVSATYGKQSGNGSAGHRRRASSGSGRLLNINPRRWTFFNEDGREPLKSPQSMEESGETDTSDDVVQGSSRMGAQQRHRRSRSETGAGRREEGPLEWYKLKWWRKRWRDRGPGSGSGRR